MADTVRKALVLGANGQDGSYLCEALVARGYDVTAIGRQASAKWPVKHALYRYVSCDIADISALQSLIRAASPGTIFHFAAVHGAAGFDYEAVWREAHLVNTLSVHAILEYIRTNAPDCRLVYASSAKAFGANLPAHLNEDTPLRASCIYSVTKNAAQGLIDYYRRKHHIAASVLYLFNHESPRRAHGYFIPRIAEALIRAKKDGGTTSLYTLDFACDWGDAREYMEIAIDVAERGLGADYVLATGKTWIGRDMVAEAFSRHGLNYKSYLVETSKPATVAIPTYQVDTTRLQTRLGRIPTRNILNVIDDIMLQDFV